MNDHKGVAIKFLVFFLLCMKCNISSVSGGGEREVRCMEREKEALLRFKQGLIDDYGVLSSWGREDHKKECCRWWGVRCSNTTGHVVGLLLGHDLPLTSYHALRGKISSALLDLHRLRYLDLSKNDFGGIRIPGFIGSIKNLKSLNLGNSNFSGIVPPQLGNLTNLRSLDLSRNSLRSDNLNWLSHLSLLSRLDLSDFHINDTNWLQQILKLHSLRELYLKSNIIGDVIPAPGFFLNSSFTSLSILDMEDNELTSFAIDSLLNTSTSLVSLDLSYNKLERFPKSLENLSHLQILSLSENELGGPLEELLGNLSTKCQLTLRQLFLCCNKLTGLVPVSLGQLSELEVIDVSFNSLEGTIAESNFMNLHNLEAFDLSYNSLTVNISPDWIPPFQLVIMRLASCNIGPHFPKWIQTQSNLEALDLSCTGISGEVPEWLWSFSPPLEALNVSSNQISGTIPDLSSTSICLIDVSSNNFSGAIPLFHPHVWIIQLRQNMFSGSISSICKIPHRSLALLDLSNNQLLGELPTCWENMTMLEILNLANNSFSGEIPHALGFLTNLLALHLRDNTLSGELPSTLKYLHSLKIIDIGGNMLTGNIPAWMGANYAKMTTMSLRRNKFYGSIPPEICNLTRIQILDLSENNLSGKILECFDNFTSLVEKNISHQDFYWAFDAYDSTDTSSVMASLVDIEYALVQWKGQELEYRRTLGLLKLIDLSSNRLVGSIPGSFSSLKGLISLNLSQNCLTGNIIPDIGQMEMLECLDLSRNQLSGEIPTGLAQLYFLAVLDLANNNLSGRIPSGTQLQSFNESAYAGNYDLCGKPLKLCPEDNLNPHVINGGENMKEKNAGFLSLSFMQEFGIAMAFGFILGFWGVVGSLILKKSWRGAYFNFLDTVGDWLYVTTTIFFNKFRSR